MSNRSEFIQPPLSEHGTQIGNEVIGLFSDLLTALETRVPAGRERALVVTKLQEAAFFAVRGVALKHGFMYGMDLDDAPVVPKGQP